MNDSEPTRRWSLLFDRLANLSRRTAGAESETTHTHAAVGALKGGIDRSGAGSGVAKKATALDGLARAAREGGRLQEAITRQQEALALEDSPERRCRLALFEADAGMIAVPAERVRGLAFEAAISSYDAFRVRELAGLARLGERLPAVPASRRSRAATHSAWLVVPRARPFHDDDSSRWAHALVAASAGLTWSLTPVLRPGYPKDHAAFRSHVLGQRHAYEGLSYLVVGGAHMVQMPPDVYLQAAADAWVAAARVDTPAVIVAEAGSICTLAALIAARRLGAAFVCCVTRPEVTFASPRTERDEVLRKLDLHAMAHADAIIVAEPSGAAAGLAAGLPAERLHVLGSSQGSIAATWALAARTLDDRLDVVATAEPAPVRQAAQHRIDYASEPAPWSALTLMKADALVLDLPVTPGHSAVLRIRPTSKDGPNPRGLLAEIAYRDVSGKLLATPYPGCSGSARRPAYVYVPVGASNGVDDVQKSLKVPAEAAHLSIRLSVFGGAHQVKLRQRPRLALRAPSDVGVWVEQVLTAERPYKLAARVAGGEAVLLRVAACDGAGASAKAIVAEIQFFDAHKQRIAPPYPGCASSQRFPAYVYVAASADGENEAFFVVWPAPARAVHVDVMLWSLAPNRTVTLTQRPVVHPLTLELARAMLASKDWHRAWLDPAARLAQGAGEVHLVEALYDAMAKANPADAGVVRRLTAVRSELTELDPQWLPSLPRSLRLEARGDALTICHLHKTAYPFENTGGAIRCLNTLKSQKALGLDPYVITPPGYPRSDGIEGAPAFEQVDGIEHFRIGPNTAGVTTLTLAERTQFAAVQAARIVSRRGASLIHAASGIRGFELALQALAMREAFGVPVIYEVRSFHEHTWGSGLKGVLERERTRMRIARENSCMALADHVVTISESMRRVLIERGVAPERIDVVPNAIDTEHYRSPPAERYVHPHLEGAQIVVGYVSNMSKREGHVHLLDAVAAVRAEGLDVRCLFVGDGPERAALERRALDLGIGDKTAFAGEVDHRAINACYLAIDIFVVPRVPDYAADWVTPLKPYEAMALERPLIVSDLPALREVVGEGDRGRLAPPGDAQGLAREIAALMRDEPARREMAARAKAWVFQHRTWAANAKLYREIYRRVLERSARGGPK